MVSPGRLLLMTLACCLLFTMCHSLGLRRERRQTGSRSCRTESGQPGSCTSIQGCPPLDRLLSQVKRRQAPPDALTQLRRETLKCEFVGGSPRVCCGDSSGSGGTSFVRPATTTARPVTRRTTTARVFRPQTTRRTFVPRTTTRRPFRRPSTTRSPISFDQPNRQTGGGGLRMSLPSEDECGMRTFNSRLFGGQDAGIGSWPWVASIGYRVRGRQDLVWGCGAALITSRHALTAAHCINGLSSNQIPEMVRLGELDFRRDPDCLPSDPSVCADRPLDAPIIGLVAHHGFRGRRNNAFADDIGVITLGLSVRTTDFVRPICLPVDLTHLSSGTDHADGQQAYIAGWGRSENTTFFTPALQEARIQMRSGSVCESTYRRDITRGLGRRLCAGTGDGVDTCRGDSGGPLMVPSPSGSNWYLTGITSFGSSRCGSNPAVYTRVHDYLNWIRNNLKVDL